MYFQLQFEDITSTRILENLKRIGNLFILMRHRVFLMCLPLKRMNESKIVGHLPREISRATKFLLDRGANVTARLSSTHYRRSPLFQGGLEIPCTVKGFLSCQRRSRYVERKVQRNS